MHDTKWQLLFADDEIEICCQVKEYLEDSKVINGKGKRLEVKTLCNFESVARELETRHIDLLILDVRLQSQTQTPEKEVGEKILEEVRQKRFLPVIFYTALPSLVQEQISPLVHVVEKTERVDGLLKAIEDVFGTGLPQINRALVRHLESVQRDYMWCFVAEHWSSFEEVGDPRTLAYLLARRLSMSLSNSGVREFAKDLGDSHEPFTPESKVHPMEFYVLPPVEGQSPQTGSLFSGDIEGKEGHWILLTPSCDLVKGREKADSILVAFCEELDQQNEYIDWNPTSSEQSKKRDALKSLLSNNRHKHQSERFYFLPGALTLPHLLVDFQQLKMVPRCHLQELKPEASLDNPYSEALLARFSRYFGRLGVPDLDTELLLSNLCRKKQDSIE